MFAPNQGVLPYPHDAYFTPTPGVPTDGTLNLPSSAFFPATVRIPGTTTTEPVVNALDGFSTQAPIKLRFSSAVDITTAAAGIRLVEVHVDPATKATIGFPPTSSPVRRVLTQDVDYRAEIAPNIDAGGTLVQLVPIRPLLPNNDAPGATRPRDIGYLVLVTNALQATNGNAFAPDADYATIKSAALANTCATITNARLQALCGLARAHFGAAARRGRESRQCDRVRQLHHAIRRHGVARDLGQRLRRALRPPPWCCRCRWRPPATSPVPTARISPTCTSPRSRCPTT